jgi:uncharacterized protein YqjF (DUF2071 family)
VGAERVRPEPATRQPVTPEPVTPDAPRLPGRTLMTQQWLEATFLHWAVDPDLVAPLLPADVAPDMYQGTTYVGLIAFRMHRIGWLSLPGLPYIGSFPETNVRLYSVDAAGRRGVVFRSLEASRLLPVATARAAFGLPYRWARMSIERSGDVVSYTSRRREPGPSGRVRSALRVQVGAAIAEPSELDLFVTARWRLHFSWLGRTVHMPNEHPPWPLYQASLLHCSEELVAAAGLPAPVGAPVSVLYSPGVPVRFGRPYRV